MVSIVGRGDQSRLRDHASEVILLVGRRYQYVEDNEWDEKKGTKHMKKKGQTSRVLVCS